MHIPEEVLATILHYLASPTRSFINYSFVSKLWLHTLRDYFVCRDDGNAEQSKNKLPLSYYRVNQLSQTRDLRFHQQSMRRFRFSTLVIDGSCTPEALTQLLFGIQVDRVVIMYQMDLVLILNVCKRLVLMDAMKVKRIDCMFSVVNNQLEILPVASRLSQMNVSLNAFWLRTADMELVEISDPCVNHNTRLGPLAVTKYESPQQLLEQDLALIEKEFSQFTHFRAPNFILDPLFQIMVHGTPDLFEKYTTGRHALHCEFDMPAILLIHAELLRESMVHFEFFCTFVNVLRKSGDLIAYLRNIPRSTVDFKLVDITKAVVRSLSQETGDLQAPVNSLVDPETGDNLLHISASNNHVLLDHLVSHTNADVNSVNHRMQTPLFIAAMSDNTFSFDLLVERKCDMFCRDIAGKTYLDYLPADHTFWNYFVQCYIVAKSANKARAKKLINYLSQDQWKQNLWNQIPNGDLSLSEIVRKLTDSWSGATDGWIDKDGNGETLLHIACRLSLNETVSALLDSHLFYPDHDSRMNGLFRDMNHAGDSAFHCIVKNTTADRPRAGLVMMILNSYVDSPSERETLLQIPNKSNSTPEDLARKSKLAAVLPLLSKQRQVASDTKRKCPTVSKQRPTKRKKL